MVGVAGDNGIHDIQVHLAGRAGVNRVGVAQAGRRTHRQAAAGFGQRAGVVEQAIGARAEARQLVLFTHLIYFSDAQPRSAA